MNTVLSTKRIRPASRGPDNRLVHSRTYCKFTAGRNISQSKPTRKPREVTPRNRKPPLSPLSNAAGATSSPNIKQRLKQEASTTTQPIKSFTRLRTVIQPINPKQIENYFETSSELEEEYDKSQGVTNITLLKPLYAHQKSTVIFDYPTCCEKQPRLNERTYLMTQEQAAVKPLFYKISKKSHVYNAMVEALNYNGVIETDHGLPHSKRARKMKVFQKYNHFPGS